MKNTNLFARGVSFIMALTIVMIPLSASAQYYYDQSYPSYGYGGYSGYTGYSGYSGYPSYPGYAGYSAPVYTSPQSFSYSYSYPTYSDPYSYNSNYNYSPYSYSNNNAYPRVTSNNNKSATHELRYVTDLDGNIIGEYRTTGSSYNPYYGRSGVSYTPNTILTTVRTYEIDLKNNNYSPSTVTIKKGSTIKWTNKDNRSHSVTGDKSSYNISSGTLKYNKSYSKKFNNVGTYYYHDKYYGSMKGKIIVVN